MTECTLCLLYVFFSFLILLSYKYIFFRYQIKGRLWNVAPADVQGSKGSRAIIDWKHDIMIIWYMILWLFKSWLVIHYKQRQSWHFCWCCTGQMKLSSFPHSHVSTISLISLIFIDIIINLKMSKTSEVFLSVYII